MYFSLFVLFYFDNDWSIIKWPTMAKILPHLTMVVIKLIMTCKIKSEINCHCFHPEAKTQGDNITIPTE